MQNVFMQILVILGSLGLFLYGMKCMSEALQKMAGVRMRRILRTVSATPLRGVAVGGIVTAVIQSSSASTVMIVSFVHAGLLTLTQAIGMIMGANIGTTATAWIIALFGFELDLGMAALPLVAVGFPMLVLRNEKWKSAGGFIIGFALLLLAIRSLEGAFGTLSGDGDLTHYLDRQEGGGYLPLLCFAGIGLLVTAVLQSSSATMALTLVLCGGGWIPFECGAAMILGENIGTTSTANIAAIMTNTDGKRTALAHTLFNVIGVLWALPLLPLAVRAICALAGTLGTASPCADPAAAPVYLAFFHTMFNLTNALLLAGFIPQLARLTIRLIPGTHGTRGSSRLHYLSSALLSTGGISIVQAQQELTGYARRTAAMFRDVKALFRETNGEEFGTIYRRIEQTEEASDRTRNELYTFLGRASREDIGADAKRNIETLFRLISDVEILSDCNYSIAKLLRAKKERGIWFGTAMREGATRMMELTCEAFEVMLRNLEADPQRAPGLETALSIEEKIDAVRSSLREQYLGTGTDEENSRQAGIIFADLITRIEQLADMVVRISEDITELKTNHA